MTKPTAKPTARPTARPQQVDPGLSGVFLSDGVAPIKPIDPALPSHLFQTPTQATSPPARRRHRPQASEESDLPDFGAIIDKYRIEQILGIGGFAAVYRATHLMLNMQVAIKMLRPRVVQRHPELAARLCEEARFVARVNHPNVVRVYDVTHNRDITYIVMEYIEGETLAEVITRQGRLPPAQVLQIGADVAAGLRAALAQRLIHRDIKPANILLERAGAAKIVDLGLARRDEDMDEPRPPGAAPILLGTPRYMAPEQGLTPERTDFRADIYSLGVTLYHAAVGVPPFTAGNPQLYLDMHLNSPPPPPEQIVGGFPPALSSLLLRMLAKNPRDRYPSYDSLAEAISKTLAALDKVE